ncbi:MAG: dipeptide epimerase [Bacteroidia bacterium]|nr:dipeptide epimerase [Bacteroidia bacterium]
MNIREIRIHRTELGLTRPYTIAYRTVDHSEVIWAEVIADNGMVGIGAANPSPMVTGETIDDTHASLRKFANTFVGKSIYAIRDLSEGLLRTMVWPGARAVLDIAFHDLLGKLLDKPLVDMFGRRHKALPTSITIGIKGVDETLEEALEYAGRGFLSLKVKLGHSLEEDIERLAKLREHFGQKIHIRVDANQGYSRSELQRFFQETADFELELIEQPLKFDDLEGMRQLPIHQKSLIAADESIKSFQNALELIRPEPACGIFNLKLMKSGGIYPAMQIADLARHAGIRLMWGCNDESIVSITAALHAAFACPNTAFLDLDGSLDMATDIVSGGFILKDGMLMIGHKPGLGLEKLAE